MKRRTVMYSVWLAWLTSLLMLDASVGQTQTVTVIEPPADWRNESIVEGSGRICSSFDIRNSVSELLKMAGCRIIEGNLQILLFQKTEEQHFNNISFPELMEITGYFLLYEVNGLKSLGTLFPNLSVIRGRTLFDDYALIVYGMFVLEDLGLRSLSSISRGAVRIEDNPKLCYLNTIPWSTITASGAEHIIANKPVSECTGCREDCISGSCWSSEDCQPTQQPQCHHLCLGGCTGPGANQCKACRRVLLHGECLNSCPPDRLEYLGHHCITPKQCSFMGLNSTAKYWPFNNSCVKECPRGYVFVTKGNNTDTVIGCEPCGEQCPCFGARVDSIAAAQNLSGCTHINGSIEIEIRGGQHVITELEENLGAIQEIYGSLKIVRSFPLISLEFLKSLRVIRGKTDTHTTHSLIVHNNPNLKELWDWKKKPSGLKILSGRLFIHNNPKLCLTDIEELNKIAGLGNFTKHEVSQESNGYKVACNHGIQYTLKVNVTIILSKSVVIEWEQLKVSEGVIRYIVYYTEAPEKNVTNYDERGACWGTDNYWRINYVTVPDSDPKVNVHYPLTRLEPFTQYAYYVTMVTSRTSNVRQSRIQYFRTDPDRPSMPTIVTAVSSKHSELYIEWEPPRYPNGILKHFIISGTWLRDDQKFLDQRNYCKHPMTVEGSQDEESDFVLKRKRKVYNCCGKEESFEIRDNDDYNLLCEKEDNKDFISKEYSIAKEDSCNDYIHTFLSTHLPEQQEDEFHLQFQTKNMFPENSHPSKASWPPWGYRDPLDPNNNLTIKRSRGSKMFCHQVDSNVTTFTVTNLRHFTKYVIKVLACRHAPENDYTRCSFANLVTTRTKAQPGANDIDLIDVDVKSWNNATGKVQVHWTPPKKPNGIIVLYHIEYNNSVRPQVDCITRKDHELQGGNHIISNLSPGKYTFRIRATSLAGTGAYSQPMEFHVREPMNPKMLEHIISIALGVLFTLGFVITIMVYFRSRLKRQLWLIASVNPDYVSSSHYIEDHWEIPRQQVRLERELGQGSFGKVYEGALEDRTRCAVKMVNDNSTNRERLEFLNEASVMKSFSDAYHVVRLLGVVSRGEPPLVVMELMSLGDLKSYLRARRDSQDGPDLEQILKMAAQIADGMAYLEARKFVHRDLAARNCMLAEDLTVKVGDFGMTRDIYETDYYRNGTKGMLPVRWMAPESLADGVFTSQSDVWSFGVVLWEMATLAEQPYQGLANEQVLALVLGGATLEHPTLCPDILRAIMTVCWKWRSNARPNFLQLVQWIDKNVELGARFELVSYYHSKEKSRVDIYPDIDSQQLVARWTLTNPLSQSLKVTDWQPVPKLSPPPKKVHLIDAKEIEQCDDSKY